MANMWLNIKYFSSFLNFFERLLKTEVMIMYIGFLTHRNKMYHKNSTKNDR